MVLPHPYNETNRLCIKKTYFRNDICLKHYSVDTRQTTAAAKRSDWDGNIGLNFNLN